MRSRVAARGVVSTPHRCPRSAAVFSEHHLIEFDLKTQVLCLVGLIAFVVFVALGFHYSSIEVWNKHVAAASPSELSSALLFGTPRVVRSDEWRVSTPALLNVYARPGGPSPARRVLDVVSPWNWGFYVLGLERGFSFMWNFWYFGAFFSFFFLMKLLTRNDFAVALFSALFLFFSSYNRWWDITIEITTFSAAVIALIYFLQSRKLLNVWLAFVVFCIFALAFVLLRYPAWQVTLAYLGIVLVAGFVAGNGFQENLRSHLKTKVTLAAAAVVGAVVLGAIGYVANAATIHAMLNTSYPADRVSIRGRRQSPTILLRVSRSALQPATLLPRQHMREQQFHLHVPLPADRPAAVALSHTDEVTWAL